MLPKELRKKYELTNYQLALALGCAEPTVKQYCSSPEASSYRDTPLPIRMLCECRNKEWEQQGVPKKFSQYNTI